MLRQKIFTSREASYKSHVNTIQTTFSWERSKILVKFFDLLKQNSTGNIGKYGKTWKLEMRDF